MLKECRKHWHPGVTLSPFKRTGLFFILCIFIGAFIQLINFCFSYRIFDSNWEMKIVYERSPGARHYRNYIEDIMANALNAVNISLIKKIAAATFYISSSILVNRCLRMHTRSVGRPILFTHEEEQLISKTLEIVAD